MNDYHDDLSITRLSITMRAKRHLGCVLAVSLLLSLSTAAFADADTYMNTLISQAIQSHPLVGSARADQQATTESIRAAKLNLLPLPTVSSGYDREDGIKDSQSNGEAENNKQIKLRILRIRLNSYG